jgi:hypothetical protein
VNEPPLTALARPLGSASPALLIALVPKCPACLGAYLAVASSVGLDRVSPGALQGIAVLGLAIALVLLGRAAARPSRGDTARRLRGTRRWLAFAVAVLGAVAVTWGRLADAPRAAVLAGVGLLYAGALPIYLGRRPERRACHSS